MCSKSSVVQRTRDACAKNRGAAAARPVSAVAHQPIAILPSLRVCTITQLLLLPSLNISASCITCASARMRRAAATAAAGSSLQQPCARARTHATPAHHGGKARPHARRAHHAEQRRGGGDVECLVNWLAQRHVRVASDQQRPGAHRDGVVALRGACGQQQAAGFVMLLRPRYASLLLPSRCCRGCW